MKRVKLVFGVVFLAFLISIGFVLSVGKQLNPTIRSYSEIEAKRFGTFVINYSLDKDFLKSLNGNIFETTNNDIGEIQMIDFKTKEVNEVLEKATEKVQKQLINLENGNIGDMNIADTFKGLRYKQIKNGIVCELPMGVVFSNSLLSNTGPVIPIKFNFIGQVLTNLNTEVETYGINSVYIEVKLHIEITELITMPLRTEEVKIETDIPLTIKVIQGTIPNYYQQQLQKDSSIFTLPIE